MTKKNKDDLTKKQITEIQQKYGDDLRALEKWFKDFFAEKLFYAAKGSNDTFYDLTQLKERLEKEGLESVAQNYDDV